MSAAPPPAPGRSPLEPQHALPPGRLGAAAITFFVVSAAGPLVAVAGGVPVGMLFGNGAGMPAAYLVVTAILVAFSVGYTAMARHVKNAGGFYAFARAGLGPMAGGAAAVVALVAYNAMQIGIYGMFGRAASALIEETTGLQTPWWASAYGALALVALCGYRRIDVSVRVLGVLVIAEYLCVLGLDAAILAAGGDSGITVGPFTPAAFLAGAPAIGLLFCFASFIGFEATTIYAEEAKAPERTVPLATYASVLLIGAFYALTTWCMVLGAGEARLVPQLQALTDPTRLLFQLSDRYVGAPLTLAMSLLFVSSVFAGLLAFHNAVARYVHALARDGLLPRALAAVHPVHGSPHRGSVLQTLLAFAVVTLFAGTGGDPVLTLFNWLTNVGTLGVLVLMALASFAVPAFFRRFGLATAVLPIAAGLAISAAVALAVAKFDLLTGASPALAMGLPAIVGVAALVGALLGRRWIRPRP